jgi:hypothetical protein
LSDNRDFFEAYYDQVTRMLGHQDGINFFKNKKIGKNPYPIDYKKAIVNQTLKTKIIDKDDFNLTSPVINNQNVVKKDIVQYDTFGGNAMNKKEDDQVKIIDDEEEFDHEI